MYSSIQSAKKKKNTTGATYGSDHELLLAKFRLKLKKVGKTTRPFRYDLNQIPYDYTEEVRNRFKGLDLIDRVPGETLDWKKHKLESRLPGEISITSDMQMTPLLWQKVKRN